MDTYQHPGVTITRVAEALHDVAAERLRKTIRGHISEGRYAHVVDLRSMAELDSRSLAALIRALRVARDVGGSVGLIVDQPSFTRILSITGLDRVFPVYKNEADATAAFAQHDLVPA